MAIPNLKPALNSELARLNKASITWLAGRLMYLYRNKSIPGAINSSNYEKKQLFSVGDVFMYHYDAKTKDKLPYWDKFPLCVVIKVYKDGWLGLNLHYLPPNIRLPFMNKLIALASVSQSGANNRIRMKISYDILVNSQRLSAYVPCVKRYLVGYVRSKMLRIFPHEWSLVVALPFEAFTKASKQKVWADSRKKI